MASPPPAPVNTTSAVQATAEGTGIEERLRSFSNQLQSEAGVLERVMYKHKNQHRRCPYFQSLIKVRRDMRLLLSARLDEILNALLPIISGSRSAHRAHLHKRVKGISLYGKYSYYERLLGVARLLSQMAEPILKAAVQISLLLAKSFFVTFSVTTLAMLARFRLLTQQMMLDVVFLFNKVADLSRKKNRVKLVNEGIEAYREYYPSGRDILILECTWKDDKFVLVERACATCEDEENKDGETLLGTPIQYETIELFDEAKVHKDLMESSSPRCISDINHMDCIKNCDRGVHLSDKTPPS